MVSEEQYLRRLDLTRYGGQDIYSDGDVEEDLFHFVRCEKPVEEILGNDDRWAIFYHLTPMRRNLLEWYPFEHNASLLEIGSGCGGMTGVFLDKVEKVQCVELSKRRASIAACRYHEHENLNIKVGNLNDMEFPEQFEYVTLIGVLEYAGKFTKGGDPYVDFLKQCKSYLTEKGTLIIAIENRYGLKYWAGAVEDHTGKLFDGIEGYRDNPGIRTFGKAELAKILHRVGFERLEWYYPLPDYKIPEAVFSDRYLPTAGDIASASPSYSSDRFSLFDESKAARGLLENGYFDIFANSFLVFCHL
jgi:putative methyltransferase